MLCGCGAELPCARCLRRAKLNRQHFAGEREAVLRRDEYQCQACGELDGEEILVHHRTRGARWRKLMITLCRRCHPRIHFTQRPSAVMVLDWPLLYALWRELHPRQPEQALLLGQAEAVEQLSLQPSARELIADY